MGENAEDIIDGTCCALCGQYFENPKHKERNDNVIHAYSHGYPVACKECWEPDCGYDKATANTI